MAKRGPKQRPTELNDLMGNPGHRAVKTGEFHPPIGEPPKPNRARKTIAEFYRHHGAMLAELRVLTRADWFAFRIMAEHYALALDALEQVRKDKGELLVADDKGNEHKHPLLQVWRDNSAAFLRYAAEFGLTPSARKDVKPIPDSQQISLESMLFGEGVKVAEEESNR